MIFSLIVSGILLGIDLLIAAGAQTAVPFYSRFTFNEAPHLPRLITNLANMDGVNYINIAKRAYAVPGEYAFFPLYPLLIRLVSFAAGDFVVAALGISIVCLVLALYVLRKYLRIIEKKAYVRMWFWILLLTFPTSFFFHAAYTESLFLLLFVCILYFLRTKNNAAVFFCAFLAGLTKIVGLFVFIPILVHSVPIIRKGLAGKQVKQLLITFVLIFAPFLGMLAYMVYLYVTTGDALKFIHVMSAYGEQRTGMFVLFPQVVYRYIKILLTAQFNVQYTVAGIELAVFLLFFGVLCYEAILAVKNKTRRPLFWELGVFSVVNLLLPTASGSFSSLPRYVLVSLYGFILLSRIQSRYIKLFLVAVSCVLHIVLLVLHTQGYFVA